MRFILALLVPLLAFVVTAPLGGCGSGRNTILPVDGDLADLPDLAMGNLGFPDLLGLDLVNPPQGCAEIDGCYTVYAHSDNVLYKIDLAKKLLLTVGPFNAPKVAGREDTITDLAVAADDTIWAVSKGSLYTVSAVDGHVTLFGSVALCGADNIALTFTPDGKMYLGDHLGAFCIVDTTQKPPAVNLIGMIGGGYALSGDLVALSDGTMYGTTYLIGDKTNPHIDYLAKIDPATGKQTLVGKTGAPVLYGLAFDQGQFFAFSHDGTGGVFTIDPKTAKATLYNTFKDPMTNAGIKFAGAAVNPMVMAPPPG